MANTSLYISGISLLLSIITIYYTFLRPAKLKIFVGPFIIIAKHENFFTFYISATIANKSSQSGVIRKSTLILTKMEEPHQNYYMLWNNFRKVSDNGDFWILSNTVSSIVILSKSTENRNIEFRWDINNAPTLRLKKGNYQVKILFWSNKEKPIDVICHEFHISESDERHLENSALYGSSLKLPFDNERNMNELLTKSQVEKLI